MVFQSNLMFWSSSVSRSFKLEKLVIIYPNLWKAHILNKDEEINNILTGQA